jgi:hypothetical protein
MCAYGVLPANAAGVCGASSSRHPTCGLRPGGGLRTNRQKPGAHYWAHCRVVCNLEQPPVSAALTRPLLDVSSSVDVDLRTRSTREGSIRATYPRYNVNCDSAAS